MVISIKEYEENVLNKKQTFKANTDLLERTSPPVHAGEILKEEFMKPLGISVNQLAKDINVSSFTIRQLINKKRRLTPYIAWKLAKYFGTTPEFWLKFQNQYDLWIALHKKDKKYQKDLKSMLKEIKPVKI